MAVECDIVTTPGDPSASSYADIDDADAYHEAHVALDTWDGYPDAAQCRALKMSSRLLDQWFQWQGATASADQALLWPRVGAVGPNGYQEPSDAIPLRIVQATAELARQLLAGDRTADSDVETKGIRRLKVDTIELEFSGAVSAKVIPDAVVALVGVYGVRQMSGAGAVTVQRG